MEEGERREREKRGRKEGRGRVRGGRVGGIGGKGDGEWEG